MKKIFQLFVTIALTSQVFAQSPQKMSYQAVIRNSSNQLITNQMIGIQISIIQGSVAGSMVYTEIQSPTTNANGLVSIEIGGGISSHDFSTINWSNGPYFVKTETDPIGGTNYTIIGTSQLLSVPYALYAEKAGNTGWEINEDTLLTDKFVRIGENNVKDKSSLHVKSLPNIATGITLEGSSNQASNSSIRFYNESERISAIGVSLSGNGFYSSDAKVGDFIIRSENHNMIFSTSSLNDYKSALYISKTGEIGINTSAPQRSLHVNDVLRLQPRDTAPINPVKGDMYMDNISNKLMVYDGVQWNACW